MFDLFKLVLLCYRLTDLISTKRYIFDFKNTCVHFITISSKYVENGRNFVSRISIVIIAITNREAKTKEAEFPLGSISFVVSIRIRIFLLRDLRNM